MKFNSIQGKNIVTNSCSDYILILPKDWEEKGDKKRKIVIWLEPFINLHQTISLTKYLFPPTTIW